MKENKLEKFTPDEEYQLTSYFSGTIKDHAQQITDGTRDGVEGKRNLTVTEFQKLCEASLDSSKYDIGRHHGELHAFFCISWALVARLETTATLHSSHLEWENDCLKIGIAKSKKVCSVSATITSLFPTF